MKSVESMIRTAKSFPEPPEAVKLPWTCARFGNLAKLFYSFFHHVLTMSERTICDDIVTAFDELEATTLHLSEIYEQVRLIRERREEYIGDYSLLKAYIRWTLQNNSRRRGRDIFIMIKKGSGIWSVQQP
jgi:hypothetical protein